MRKYLVLVAVLALLCTGSYTAWAAGASSTLPACIISNIVKSNTTANASGSCKLHGAKVGVHWTYKMQTTDAQGYSCSLSPTTGNGNSVKLVPPGDFNVIFTLSTTKKWNGHVVSKTRSTKLLLGGDQLMCGGTKAAPSTPSTVCDWGTAPASGSTNTSYCGQQYWYPPNGCQDPAGGCAFGVHGAPAATWTSKPSINGNTVMLGHFVSPSGACRETAYPYPSTDGWWHTLDFNNWQCGNQVVETDFLAWLVTPSGKTCQLPSNNGDWGTGVTKFQVPSDWGGQLQLMPELFTYVGTAGTSRALWKAVAFERASKVLPLSGTADGCAQLGLPTN